jgi:endonuclease/exonuclease/phosphatase family metal-dependent hydrolase
MHISIFSQNLANKTVISSSISEVNVDANANANANANVNAYENAYGNTNAYENAYGNTKEKGIYVEFTQENALVSYTSLLSQRQAYITHKLNLKTSSFNVITKVFCDPSLIKSYESGHIHLNSGSGNSVYTLFTQAASAIRKNMFDQSNKGVVWIKLVLDTFSLLLVNMHLPVDPTRSDYGNEYRTKCFKESLDSLSHHIDDSTLLIVGGDLNFRVQGKDQLTTLLETYTLQDKPLYDLTGPEPTCKFTTKCLSNKIRCFDTKRTPSRCDRMLANKPLAVTSKTIILDPTLDHNGVFVKFTYPVTGGRRTRTRSKGKSRKTRSRV